MSSLSTSGLGARGGEVLRQRVEASIHRGWTPRTEPNPPLWSVLGVQAGREVGDGAFPA